MNNCMDCGSSLETVSNDSWVIKFKCHGCGVRYKVILPDHMSGNHSPEIIKLSGPNKETSIKKSIEREREKENVSRTK